MCVHKNIRVAAEYECHPLWVPSDSGEDNLSASDLPISKELAERFERWSDEYEATYDRANPIDSGFTSPEAARKFAKEGSELARRLREELPTEWQVSYFDPETGKRERIE